jgi:hypothetical protein
VPVQLPLKKFSKAILCFSRAYKERELDVDANGSMFPTNCSSSLRKVKELKCLFFSILMLTRIECFFLS